MNIIIEKNGQTILQRLRRLGYAPYRNRQGEESFVRRIQGNEFPRFHLYITTEATTSVVCSIHLDQTAPVYATGNAHRGEYDSPAVQNEVDRIQKTNS